MMIKMSHFRKRLLIRAVCLSFFGIGQSQVSVTFQGNDNLVGPGTQYPRVHTCNETASPQLVEGWKFRTQDFAGYSTWMQGLTREGAAPVEYTQKIPPNDQQQMQAGVCRAAAVDYTGTLAAGQNGTLFDPQTLVKTGSCSEAPPYTDAEPLKCAAIPAQAPTSFYGTQCIVDSIGTNGGESFGGLVSTFFGQTQIQAAIPSTPVTLNGMQVKWDPRSLGGPQYMMALSMAQEILNVDMQFLAAIAGKETMFGFVEHGRENLGSISEWASFNRDDDGAFSPWEIEATTFARTMQSYPQFYPKYGPCMGRFRDVTTAASCSGDNGQWTAASAFYMRTPGYTPAPGAGGTGPNSPQIANSVLSSALVWYWLYDGLEHSTDLCFADAIVNGKDPRVGLAALIPGYNLGPNSGFESALKDPNLKNDPQASLRFPAGNGDYRTNVFRLLDAQVDASKSSSTCGGGNIIYDADITWTEIRRFFYGGTASPGTPETQADGGLLLHFDLDVEQRKALQTDLECAFNRLKGKAPSTNGKEAISFRYDWLTILRVAKNYLPSRRRLVPVQSDFRLMVDRNSKNARTCAGKLKDEIYPNLTLTSPVKGAAIAPIIDPGFKVTFDTKDNEPGIKADWSMDTNWVVWNAATHLGGNKYEFHVSCKRPGYPKRGEKGALWVRSTDGCGNSTVQQLDFTAHSTAICGDPPVPPQVATPTNLPTIGISKAWYLDENGDGHIDKAIVQFEKVPPSAPEKLTFRITGEDGKEYVRTASAGEITLSGNRAIVTFVSPFDQGITSLRNRDFSGQTFRQDNFPLNDGAFAVDDSIPPIILGAEIKEPDADIPLKRVIITYSEPVTLSSEASLPLVFKRDGSELPAGAVVILRHELMDTRRVVFFIDENSTVFPIVGDSVAINTNRVTRDANGNSPSIKLFRLLDGLPPQPKPVKLVILFPNGTRETASQGAPITHRQNALFIPINKDGAPLPGHSDGKCESCQPQQGGIFVGPVFQIFTPGPLDYDFKIFSNVGEFIASGTGKINEQDLSQVKYTSTALGASYEVPIVWTGWTSRGTRVGTGAYILKATFVTGRDLRTGAQPGRFEEKKKFGLIRN